MKSCKAHKVDINASKIPSGISDPSFKIIDELDGIELGVNTDELLPSEMRHDNCHFNERGQRLAAKEAARLIVNFHKANE